MFQQVTRVARRTGTSQVLGTGHDPTLKVTDLLADDVIADHRRTETHRHIDSLADQITDPVAQRQADLQARMALKQAPQVRRDDAPAELHRNAGTQMSM